MTAEERLAEMQQKIAPMHVSMLRAMMKLNELPEQLYRRYFLMKQYLDKVDAPIRPVDLLRIAMDAGFCLETGLFVEAEDRPSEKYPAGEEIRQTDKRSPDTLDEDTWETKEDTAVVEPEAGVTEEELDSGDTATPDEPDKKKESVDSSNSSVEDLEVEEVQTEGPVDEVIDQFDEDAPPHLKAGTAVQTLDDNDFQDGVIDSVKIEGDTITYSVKVGDKIIEFDENDVMKRD